MATDYWRKARGEWVHPPEKELLYEMAQYVAETFEDPTIVNIGVSWGASVHCLHAGAPDARLVAIDIDLEWRPLYGKELLEGVEFVEADSTRYQFDGPVHLAFVDGGHDYDTVRGDIGNWVPRIPVGGVVAFHDYAPIPRDAKRLEGVKRAVDEWRKCGAGLAWVLRRSANSVVAFERVK